MGEACRVCGADLPLGGPGGHCPACLLRLALPGAADPRESTPRAETELRYFGDYELLEQVASGGEGVIYRARQLGLLRLVALKLPSIARIATPEFLERFRREGEVAASLEHPHIVPLYEAGDCEGRPYLAMKWVEGENLARWIQGVRERSAGAPGNRFDTLGGRIASLMIKVAGAIHYAHQHGVLHRDLKPGNILVDNQEEPFLTDFGLAKVLALDGDLTQTVSVMGTPNYLAPELAAGGARQSTVATDVYGLGAILYHLLTGRPPFSASSPLDALRLVLDSEPVRPRAVDPAIPADVEAICLKALNRVPRQRYASAEAMAEDLARFARKEPVLARPINRRQRLVRWAERNPVTAILSALVLCLALALVLGTPWAWWHIRAERNRAIQRANEATEQRAQAEANLRHQQVARIEGLFKTDHAIDAIALLGKLYGEHPGDARLAEWIANELTYRNFALPIVGPLIHNDRVHLVRFSPDGQRLVTASGQNVAQLWDVSSGLPLGPPLEHRPGPGNSEDFLSGMHPIYADFSPDGRWVATASVDGTARLWDAATGQPHGAALQHPDWVTFARFSPDGKLLATAGRDGVARLWDVEAGQPIGSGFVHQKWVNTAMFSPDGKRLVTASDDKTARIWDVASGKELTKEPLRHDEWVREALFSPDGRSVATISSDRTARVWDAETGAPRTPPLHHEARLTTAQFSPDGRWLAAGGFDRMVRIWRVATGELQCPPIRHGGVVRSIDFSPDGLRIVTASEDRTARVWEVRGGTPLTESLRHDDIVWSARFSPDGGSVATASSDRSVFVWDVRPGKALPLVMPADGKCGGVHWTPDGRNLHVVGRRVKGYETQTGRVQVFAYPGTNETLTMALPIGDGSKVLVATREGTADIWDSSKGVQIPPKINQGNSIAWAALSPDADLIVTASSDGKARVWNSRTGAQVREPLAHPGAVARVEFNPDGRTIATACSDFRVRLWAVREGRLLGAPLVHEGWIHDLVFSPDGHRLATASQDGTARVWDATTGRLLYPPLRHRGAVMDVDFSPDGRHLVTASRDGSARVWIAATGQPQSEAVDLGPAVLDAAFSPDGQRLALACDDGDVTVWDIFSSQPLLASLHHPAQVNSCQFSPVGPRLATAGSDRNARIWDLVMGSEAPPDWLADVVKVVVGRGTGTQENAAEAPRESVQILRSGLLSLSTNRTAEVVARSSGPRPRGVPESGSRLSLDDDWTRWLHWFISDRAKRNVSPIASMSVDVLVLDRLSDGDIPSRAAFENLLESLWIRPTDGDSYSQAAFVLASSVMAHEPDRLATVERFSRRGLELQPGTTRGLWARACYLDLAGDVAGAAAMLEKAIPLDSGNLYFWLWSATFFEKARRVERGAFALSKAVAVGDRLPWWVDRRPELHQMQADYLQRHGLSR